jgi:hypothetical protein
MKFYKFNSVAEFQKWHSLVKISLGIPDEVTLEYTQGVVVSENDVRAQIADELANGLTECLPPQNDRSNPFETVF